MLAGGFSVECGRVYKRTEISAGGFRGGVSGATEITGTEMTRPPEGRCRMVGGCTQRLESHKKSGEQTCKLFVGL